MTPEKTKSKRPLKAILSVVLLCALGAWLDISLYQEHENKDEHKDVPLMVKKEEVSPAKAEPELAPPPVTPPVPAPDARTEIPAMPATLTIPPLIAEKPAIPMREPFTIPPVIPAPPAMKLPDVTAPPAVVVVTPEKNMSPELDDLPKIPPPMEAPSKEGSPKDVTASKATTRDVEGKDEGEFGKPDEEHADNLKKMNDKGGKATSSKSSDMAGWELMNYQGHDFVTGESLQKFYRFNELKVDGNNVWFRSPVLVMKATMGSQELLINNIKFIMSYPAMELNGQPCFSRLDLCKLIDPVLRPSYIGNKNNAFDTVILDPGHGGHDSGAKGVYGYEKDFALKLAMAVKGVLEKQGLKVVMTRSKDEFISLSGRVALANKVPNSIYISLHFNSGDSSTATGIETFAFSPQGSSSIYGARAVDSLAFNGNSRDSENIALATSIHASVVHHFKLVDRGVKRARWHVLKGLERPGVLFEGGFVTNPNDCRLIAAENFRSELAATIGQAIMNYRRALQPRSGSR